MPETLLHCEVNGLGPLVVSIDPDGRKLFEENKVTFNERGKKNKALEIYPQVKVSSNNWKKAADQRDASIDRYGFR